MLAPPARRAQWSRARGPGRRREGARRPEQQRRAAGVKRVRKGWVTRQEVLRTTLPKPSPGLDGGSLRSCSGLLQPLSFRGPGRVLRPGPRAACCSPAFHPGACLSSHTPPGAGASTPRPPPRPTTTGPCSTPSAVGAGNVYLEMDEHLQFKVTQRRLLLPQSYPASYVCFLHSGHDASPYLGAGTDRGPHGMTPAPHTPTSPP